MNVIRVISVGINICICVEVSSSIPLSAFAVCVFVSGLVVCEQGKRLLTIGGSHICSSVVHAPIVDCSHDRPHTNDRQICWNSM